MALQGVVYALGGGEAHNNRKDEDSLPSSLLSSVICTSNPTDARVRFEQDTLVNLAYAGLFLDGFSRNED